MIAAGTPAPAVNVPAVTPPALSEGILIFRFVQNTSITSIPVAGDPHSVAASLAEPIGSKACIAWIRTELKYFQQQNLHVVKTPIFRFR